MMASQNPQTATGHEPERSGVFISYAREDSKFVLRLDESLRLKGIDVRGDWRLVKGAGYEEQLRLLILESDAFIFVITPQSAGSLACRYEIDIAIEMKKRILPVLHQDCDEDSLHSALRSPQWTLLRDSDDFVESVQGLIEAINTDFDLLPEHRRLLAATETWQRNGRHNSYLLRKEGLQKAERWLTQTSLQPNKLPKPTSLQSEYILASRRARTKGTRLAFAIVTAVALTMTLLTVVALAQRTIAKRNEQAARDNEALAVKNELEAKRQKEQADANAGEARRQAGIAQTNEERAKEQQQIADDNATEARRQQKLAEDNAEEAKRQKGIAVANAEEAVRRLIRLTVANGVQRLDQKDYPGAAVWFGEALKLTTGEQREARIRLAALLGEYPQVDQAFFGGEPILSARYSPDGRRVVTTHTDRTARVWDAETGRPLTPPLTHRCSVSDAAFSPDGRNLVTVSVGNQMDMRCNKEARTKESEQIPEDFESLKEREPLLRDEKAFEAFMERLRKANEEEAERMLKDHPYLRPLWELTTVTMAEAGYFQVWDAETGRALTKPTKDNFNLEHAQYTPDGRHILVWGGGARMWSVDANHVLSPAGEQAMLSPVWDAAVSPDGSRYALIGYGRHAFVYEATSGKRLFDVEASPSSNGHLRKVVFSHDGAHLATGDDQGVVRLWNAKTGASVTENSSDNTLRTDKPLESLSKEISVLTFSPDNQLLLAGTGGIDAGTFRLWEAKTGMPVTYKQQVKFPIKFAEFSPDSARLLMTIHEYAGGHTETLVWETPPVETWTPMLTMRMLSPPVMDTHSTGWHPAGQRILTTGPYDVARTWNVGGNPTLTPYSSDKGFNSLFTAKVVRREGKEIVQVVDSEGRAVGSPIQVQPYELKLAVSTDGKFVAIGQGDREGRKEEARVWDVATGRPVTPVIKQEFPPNHLEFSRDGTRLLTICYDLAERKGWARVWDARTGALVTEITHDDVVTSARFNATGNRVVTASPFGSVIVWDAATGKQSGPRITHLSASDAMFSPDGTSILSRGGQKGYEGMRLWDAQSGQLRTPPMLHAGLDGAAFSPDGRFIMSESSRGDQEIRLWLTETGEPLSPPIPGWSARWHLRDSRLLVEPSGRYKTAWRQAHDSPFIWDLSPTGESKERLALLTQFIAARRVDQAGALVELDAQSLRQVWEALKGRPATKGP